MASVVFCTASENLMHPELLGLEGIDPAGLEWLACESDAQAARRIAASADTEEVWVEGADDMDPLNLAAAICRDQPAKTVIVASADASGSLRSRAQAAGVSAVLSIDGLVQRLFIEKERHSRMEEVACMPTKEPPADSDEKTGDLSGSSTADVSSQNRDAVSLRPATSLHEAKCRRAGYVLAVLSGSGGAGKSTVSTIAAYEASARGYRVLLFDGDLQFGDIASICGVSGVMTADDVLEDPDRLVQLAAETSEGSVAFLGAPARLEQAEVVTANLPQLLEQAAGLFDVVVVNTGASWTEAHAAIIERSDRALFLIDQKASSVRACRHALGLCERMGIATGNFDYAVNRCCRSSLFSGVDVSCALDGVHVFELKDGGSEVEELLGTGAAADLIGMRNDLCQSVSSMLDELLPSTAEMSPSASKHGCAGGAASPKRTARRRSRRSSAAEAPVKRSHDGTARARAVG